MLHIVLPNDDINFVKNYFKNSAAYQVLHFCTQLLLVDEYLLSNHNCLRKLNVTFPQQTNN